MIIMIKKISEHQKLRNTIKNDELRITTVPIPGRLQCTPIPTHRHDRLPRVLQMDPFHPPISQEQEVSG